MGEFYPPLLDQIVDLVYKLKFASSRELPATPSVLNSSSQSAALNSLVSLLASSQSFDTVIGSSLSILQPHASTSNHVDLRLAIHRLTGEMTDHLASATSRLLQLVDRDELTVLGEMYDIPVAGSLYHSRKPRGFERDKVPDFRPSVPSPRNLPSQSQELSSTNPTEEGEKAHSSNPAAQVMSSSLSLPGLTRPHNHQHHPGDISSSSCTDQDGHSAEDRFTTIPPRKPRLSKRFSWDSEVWSKLYNEGLRRPPYERRITEADEENGGDTSWASEYKYGELGDRAISTNSSSSPSLRPPTPYTPSRTSPLSRSTPIKPDHRVSIHIPAATFPGGLISSPLIMDKSSPYATSSGSKRRSLQNMPYYHSSDEDPVTPSRTSIKTVTTAELTRTMSLPTSELQELRTRSAIGSRRSSLVYAHQSFSSTPPAGPARMASVSPLTVPGLKAACLGIHNKRRRMACCLLGLRFSIATSVEYWGEVKATIDELNDAIVEQREKLNRAKDSAENEESVAARLDRPAGSRPPIPLWPTAGAASTDFAPRTSDQQYVLERVDALQSALTKAWDDLATIRHSLLDSERNTELWSNLRENFGSMICEWERGKDAVCRLSTPFAGNDVPSEEEAETFGELPEFLDGWIDNSEPNPALFPRNDSLILEAEPNDSNAPDSYHELLPRPGAEQVYEATVLPTKRGQSALSVLSRDQRIQLTKEARTKGMSLGDMLVGEMDDTDAKKEEETRMRGSEVVGELKGMIGMIRRRKGQKEELETESDEKAPTSGQEVRVEVEDTAREDDVLADDLQSKFVFPVFNGTRHLGG